MASALIPVRPFALSETKIDEDTPGLCGIVKEVGRLDIAVDNFLRMHCPKRSEHALEVQTHI
jgi:hypothetical protein